MGLGRVFVFSVIFGISVSMAFGFESPALSLIQLESGKVAGPGAQNIILLGSIAMGVFSVFSMAKTFSQVIENRLYGIILVLCGFAGSVLILMGISNFHMVLGVSLCAFGIIICAKKYSKS